MRTVILVLLLTACGHAPTSSESVQEVSTSTACVVIDTCTYAAVDYYECRSTTYQRGDANVNPYLFVGAPCLTTREDFEISPHCISNGVALPLCPTSGVYTEDCCTQIQGPGVPAL